LGGEDVSIEKTGQLVDHIMAAVQEHGATPHTDIHVRVGPTGPLYRIDKLMGSKEDLRGFTLILETAPHPELY
jgi:hypothetical protein